MSNTVIRTKKCECTSTAYVKSYNSDFNPVWVCTNCLRETTRQERQRKTNKTKAFEAWEALREDSHKAMDINYHHHMYYVQHHEDQLVEIEKPSKWDIQYHSNEARKAINKILEQGA